jgi:hypothetical protein
MDAVSTSETSVNFCEITRCSIPEDSHLHTLRREKSHDSSTVLNYFAVFRKTRSFGYKTSTESVRSGSGSKWIYEYGEAND